VFSVNYVPEALMQLPTLSELEDASKLVYQSLLPSPQLHWPLLGELCGCEVWVKHENHLPTGAFKVRGGLVYLNRLRHREPDLTGLVTATRGNHGQSVAFAGGREGFRSTIVVPEGNNPEKNRSMQALGAELVIHGRDFDEASQYAQQLSKDQGLHRIPSFHIDLISGVASYALELLQSQPDLRRLYVPIGLGSGICGVICARNALGLETEIVGVVSDAADCYALSLAAGRCVSTVSANTLADGMAVRVPNPEALELMLGNVSRIVRVTDQEVLTAMSQFFTATHNIAEGAGAAPLAALCKEREQNVGAKVGLILSGGNVDRALYKEVLAA
jgi:threonine dehydratase